MVTCAPLPTWVVCHAPASTIICRPQLLLLPAAPLEVSEPITVEISSRALVRVEGAWYSTPSRWARLRATAFISVEQVRLVCMGESVIHPRLGFGRRRIVYRHYLH